MIVNCFYDECMEYADIVYIPDVEIDVEILQEKFLKWMFDKKSEHKYWIIVNSQKICCQYDTQAFIDWLNEYVMRDIIENAYMIKANALEWNKDNKSIVF